MINREDCFAYGKKCRALDVNDCDGCKTYKTWEQCYRQQIKCRERLNKVYPEMTYLMNIPASYIKALNRE